MAKFFTDSFAPQSLEGDRILIAFNKVAGSGQKEAIVEAAAAELQKHGFQTEIQPDFEKLVASANAWHELGQLRGVVAAGGDGTVGRLSNRLAPSIPLAILPLGTENLLARFLGHNSKPGTLAKLFESGQEISLDAGEVAGRRFSLMASCGFDAEVVRRLHQKRQGNIRHWNYIKPIFDCIRTYAYPELKVTAVNANDEELRIHCRWAFVVNVPRYAGGLRIVPHASPLDGLLDLCTFKDGSFLSGLSYLSRILLGSHIGSAGVECHRVGQVSIESDVADVPLQLDGDPAGILPATIVCRPGSLRVIVSPDWIERNVEATSARAIV